MRRRKPFPRSSEASRIDGDVTDHPIHQECPTLVAQTRHRQERQDRATSAAIACGSCLCMGSRRRRGQWFRSEWQRDSPTAHEGEGQSIPPLCVLVCSSNSLKESGHHAGGRERERGCLCVKERGMRRPEATKESDPEAQRSHNHETEPEERAVKEEGEDHWKRK